jgi:hypothetical protein
MISHHPVDVVKLYHMYTMLSAVFPDVRYVRGPAGGIVSGNGIVASRLENQDSGIRRKQTRETREHTPRCIAGDAGIENLGRASFGPKQTLQLGWESLVH